MKDFLVNPIVTSLCLRKRILLSREDLYVDNNYHWMSVVDLTDHAGLAALKSVHLRTLIFEVESLWLFLEKLPRPRNLILEIQDYWIFNENQVQQ